MKIRSITMAMIVALLSTIAIAEPKFVSNINGSSFVINATNQGSQAYECQYTYTFNQVDSQAEQQVNGRFYIQAGANNIAVVSRNVSQVITRLNFDYKCTEK